MIYKNVASQKLAVFAYTASTGAAKTGDAAQITAYLSKDFGAAAATNDTNPTELDATNMPGWYVFDLLQAETNAEVLVLAAKSSTSGVVVDQIQVLTQDAAISSRLAPTTNGRTLNVSSGGVADADMTAISTDATAADNLETMLDGTGGQVLTLKKLVVNNTDGAPTNAVEITGYNGIYVEGQNRGMTLFGNANQALYLLSDTATSTVYIEGPSTGGKGLAISSPSDGSSLPNASGIYIQTENGHPGILFNFTDPADAIKVVNSDNGSWVLDDLISAINAKTTNLPASPAAVGSPMTLADDAITAAKFDESTAYPLKQADTGSTAVARTGADADTLKTLSDQVDGVGGSGLTAQETRDAMKLAPSAGAAAAGSIDAHLDSLLAYGAGTGTGTYTDTVTDGVDPLDNVLVQLSTDSAGANMAYRAYTGADGVFVMSPDPGTYYVWFELAGYSFTQGAEVVVT